MAVTVPWSNLLKDNCFFEIRGLTVTCQVKKRAHPSQLTASLFHSMCESFSSKDVAEECLRQKDINEDNIQEWITKLIALGKNYAKKARVSISNAK